MRLRDLISEFDGFVIDQYGVLHDGVRAYAGAIPALEAIRAAGKRAVLMTNSGKSAAANEERLTQLGFARELYAALVSSGEAARLGMEDGAFGPAFALGGRVHVIGRTGDDYGLDRFPLQPVDLAVADALLILGSDAPRVSLDEYSERLKPAAARNLPALCANPDLLMLTKSGQQPAPGAIARLYETLGGKVVYVGKPHAFIYAIALRALAGVEPRRILAVGDSPLHDVEGAANAGLATALVKAGLSAGRDHEELRRKAPIAPDFVLDGL
jgi:HAD superfamily hydrolase (TIGR01459 family)